jgi:hypothetical protein
VSETCISKYVFVRILSEKELKTKSTEEDSEKGLDLFPFETTEWVSKKFLQKGRLKREKLMTH